jgi:hypothetical protein
MQGRHAESWDIHVDATVLDAGKFLLAYVQKEFYQTVMQVEMNSRAWIAGGGARQM